MLEPNSFERKLLNQLFFEHTVNSKKVLILPEVNANYVIKNIKKKDITGLWRKKKKNKKNKDQTVLNESYYINYFEHKVDSKLRQLATA